MVITNFPTYPTSSPRLASSSHTTCRACRTKLATIVARPGLQTCRPSAVLDNIHHVATLCCKSQPGLSELLFHYAKVTMISLSPREWSNLRWNIDRLEMWLVWRSSRLGKSSRCGCDQGWWPETPAAGLGGYRWCHNYCHVQRDRACTSHIANLPTRRRTDRDVGPVWWRAGAQVTRTDRGERWALTALLSSSHHSAGEIAVVTLEVRGVTCPTPSRPPPAPLTPTSEHHQADTETYLTLSTIRKTGLWWKFGILQIRHCKRVSRVMWR